MFKHVVPVLGLILLAGPVFAADTPATDTSAAPTTKSTSKHHSHSKKHHHKTKSTDASTPK